MDVLTKLNLEQRCDTVAQDDAGLRRVIQTYGYPPFWSRPNTFESLVQIILEQQVSLASAKAAYVKVKAEVGDITPENIVRMSDEQFRMSYFSRQKTAYVRGLAQAIIEGALLLQELEDAPDETVRETLTKLKGIGNWTVDIYLIEVLHRPDVFPAGDIAAMNALKAVRGLTTSTKDEAIEIARSWQPNRTAATLLLWHQYLASRGRSEEMLAST